MFSTIFAVAFLILATVALDVPRDHKRGRIYRVTDMRTGRTHKSSRAGAIGARGALVRSDRDMATAMATARAETRALCLWGSYGASLPMVERARARWAPDRIVRVRGVA